MSQDIVEGFVSCAYGTTPKHTTARAQALSFRQAFAVPSKRYHKVFPFAFPCFFLAYGCLVIAIQLFVGFMKPIVVSKAKNDDSIAPALAIKFTVTSNF